MKHSQEGKWVHSLNDEIFHTNDYFTTKEEAIKGGKVEYEWDGECPTYYVGQVVSANTSIHVNVDGVLETISESIYDEVGEIASDYLNDVTKEHQQVLEDELNSAILQWMNKFGYSPTFFKVVNIEKVTA